LIEAFANFKFVFVVGPNKGVDGMTTRGDLLLNYGRHLGERYGKLSRKEIWEKMGEWRCLLLLIAADIVENDEVVLVLRKELVIRERFCLMSWSTCLRVALREVILAAGRETVWRAA
jgi:hypothetical protein